MSGPFILRPIATTLMIVAMLLLGMLGYRVLPVAALPSVDFPTIQITTAYPGAAPEVVETSITAPLEHYFGQISGLTEMSSISGFGTSTITLQFNLSRKIDAAAQDVQAQINAANGWVPISLLPGPPTYREVNPADTPVIILALTSDTLPLHEVDDYAQTVIVQKLSQVSGVGAVTIEGGQTRAIRLQANPALLAGLGLSMEDIRRAVAASTIDNPKGSLDGATQAFQIGANDQLFTSETYGDVVVAYRNGAPVKLRDIGRAIEGPEDAELAGWFNGAPAVILDIQRQPGANTIAVVDAVRDLLPRLRAQVPPGLKVSVVTDRTITIRAAIADVQFTLVLTVALVVLVIFLFLRKLWATVIPSVTLPVSLVATFGGMALCGFSLDNLSLMALTVASGFVVDDAIVMIENIVRYIEAGEAPLPAALKGARQIGFTVVSLTVSLVAVFIPLLLMGGIVGRLFREFAITLSLAVIVSGFVSLTLTPMMCARLLRGHDAEGRPNLLFRISERGFDAAPSPPHDARLLRDTRGHVPAGRSGAQRVSAAAGHGPADRCDRRPAGYLVSRHGRAAAGDRRRHRARSRCAQRGQFRGGRHGQCHAEQRAAVYRHWRAGPPRPRAGRDRPPAPGGRWDRRDRAVSPAGPGSHHRDPHLPHPVPIHPAGSRRRRTAPVEHAPRRGAEAGTGAGGRDQRPPGRGVAHDDHHRPRRRRAHGRDADRDRPDAVRRLRAAPDCHRVLRADPVSCHPGGRSALPRRPLRAEQDLRHLRQRAGRHRQRRGQRHLQRLPHRLRPHPARRLRPYRAATGPARHHP
jgi:hypothetical protein